jgi:hypothetical protein
MSRAVPITRKILAEAAALPLRDAAWKLWSTRDFFIREAEHEAPSYPADSERAEAYGATFAASLKRDREAAPDSDLVARLRLTHPDAGERTLTDAVRAAVAFDDACFKGYAFDVADDWERACRAVASAAVSYPGYLETTLQAVRMRVATAMR